MPKSRFKCFVGQIDERHGEYEFSTTILLEATSLSAAEKRLEDIASAWYGDEMEGDAEEGWDNGDDICVTAGDIIRVSRETFNSLKELLTEM